MLATESELSLGKLVALPCRIQRFAFSAERIFRIALADGGEYAGTAWSQHMFIDGKRVGPHQPTRCAAQPWDERLRLRMLRDSAKALDHGKK